MSDQEAITLLRDELAAVSWWMSHTDCEIEQIDFCTCGMKQAKDHARTVYNETAPK